MMHQVHGAPLPLGYHPRSECSIEFCEQGAPTPRLRDNRPPRDGLTPEFRGWLHEHDEELSNDSLLRFLAEIEGRGPDLAAVLAAESPAATLTCTVCGDSVPADGWAFHVHSVPGDLCGRVAPDEPTCTLPSGHDGAHEQWEATS